MFTRKLPAIVTAPKFASTQRSLSFRALTNSLNSSQQPTPRPRAGSPPCRGAIDQQYHRHPATTTTTTTRLRCLYSSPPKPETAASSTGGDTMPELTGDPNQHPASKFDDGLSGHCLCGSINVTIKDRELFREGARRGHLCHCANCRKVAGSYVASNLIIDESAVDIVDRNGTLREFVDTQTGSGKPLSRFFCGTCGKLLEKLMHLDIASPVKSVTPAYPGKIVVKMGMFPRIPAPEFETFGDHRHEWQGKHDGMKTYKIKAGGELLEH